MDSLYKRFYYSLATFKLTGFDATSFPGLDKHAGGIKDAKQRMAAMSPPIFVIIY